jgi:hypothetical protein
VCFQTAKILTIPFNGLFPKENLKLTVNGKVTEYQLADIKENEEGFIVSAKVMFKTSLNKNETKNIVLSYDPDYEAVFDDGGVGIAINGDTATISTGKIFTQVPYGQISASEVNNRFGNLPAPIKSISTINGNVAIGSLLSDTLPDAGIACMGLSAGIVAEKSGNLSCLYRVVYHFSGGRTYTVDLTFRYNESYITVDEYVDGNFTLGNNMQFRLAYTDIDPIYRLGIGNGGYGRNDVTYGAYTKNLVNENYIYNHNNNVTLKRLDGTKTGIEVYDSYSWCFWNPNKSEGIVFAPYRTADWKYKRGYDSWSWDFKDEELNFYSNDDGEKFMQVRMYTPERHWAVSIIPTKDIIIDEINGTRSYKPVYDENFNFVGYDGTWGGGPEVRLWQRLTDFSLDFYKDLVFDFDENIEREGEKPKFTLPDHIPSKQNYNQFMGNNFINKFEKVADQYWNFQSDISGINFGHAKPLQMVNYIYNRSSWTKQQREHARALFIWLAYALQKGENPVSARYSALLGGQPNFMAPWIMNLYLCAAAFPEHPAAQEWKETADLIFERWCHYYIRKADTENNAEAGRFMENPICYNFASIDYLWRADYALRQYDGTSIWNNDNAINWAEWMLNILIPNMSFVKGVRIPPSEGAHANPSLFNVGAQYYKNLEYMSEQLEYLANNILKDDSDRTNRIRTIGENIAWSITNGVKGTKPVFTSKLYTDYGPVMRYGEAGSEDEAYLHMTHINGRNYRWGDSNFIDGTLFYSAGKYNWSWNGMEDNGDRANPDMITNFTVDKDGRKGILRAPSTGVLFNFGEAQQYYAIAANASPMNGRGVMMIRGDYIAVLDDIRDKNDTGKFTWTNQTNRGLKIEHFENPDFTGLTNVLYGYRSGGDGRFPIAYFSQSQFEADAMISDYNSFSVVFSGIYKPENTTTTFKQNLGSKDTGRLILDGVTVLEGGNGATNTVTGLNPNEYVSFRYEYVHNPNGDSVGGDVRCEVTPINGDRFMNDMGLPAIFPPLDEEPAPGDQIHIVAPTNKNITVGPFESWGVKVNNNGVDEYVFYSSEAGGEQTKLDANVIFTGNWGYARENYLALFKGTKLGFGELVIEKHSGAFGISAEYKNNAISGCFAGKQGGTVTISLPSNFTSTPVLKIDGQTVSADYDQAGHKITYNVQITQPDGVKNYSITAE